MFNKQTVIIIFFIYFVFLGREIFYFLQYASIFRNLLFEIALVQWFRLPVMQKKTFCIFDCITELTLYIHIFSKFLGVSLFNQTVIYCFWNYGCFHFFFSSDLCMKEVFFVDLSFYRSLFENKIYVFSYELVDVNFISAALIIHDILATGHKAIFF